MWLTLNDINNWHLLIKKAQAKMHYEIGWHGDPMSIAHRHGDQI